MMKLQTGAPIQINCPSGAEHRYPAFHAAFHGRAGRVLAIEPRGAAGVIQVDVSREGEAGVWINVARDWLSHAEGKRT